MPTPPAAPEPVDRPFRFGVHLWALSATEWAAQAQHYESLGFSTITFTDHLVVPQWEPFTALGAIAGVTERIHVGTLVLDMALRNPVLTAKAAATLTQLSGGRLELGLGAGYVARNFSAGGVPFGSAADRIDQLAEAVQLLRRLWTDPSTTLHGRFYDIVEAPMVSTEPVRPTLLIGGGGPKVMALAGRSADIVSMIPRQPSGDWSVVDSLPDSTIERMAQKAQWVRRAAEDAGRDPTTIELNTMVARTIIGDDVGAAIAEEAAASGVHPDQITGSTLYLCGNGEQLREQLHRWRDEIGISYVSFFDPDEEQVAYLAEHVVGPLGGR